MTAAGPSSNNKPKRIKPGKDNGGNIRVVVRVRPLSDAEKSRGCERVITSMDQAMGDSTAEKGSQTTTTTTPAVLEVISDMERNEKRWFEFDAVLGDESTQVEAYEQSGAKQAVVEDIFKGYNATLLAYGQTGAGKSYTMGSAVSDSSSNAGILQRACEDLFTTIHEKCDGNGRVEMSYLEIYNEEIRDLLSPTTTASSTSVYDKEQPPPQPLKVREKLNGEVYVSGLTSRKVASPLEIGAIMDEASERRVVGSTAMNAVSSRSHAICTFRIKGILGEGSEKFTSKLTLVDLAGSERIKKTGAEGSRAVEGIHINKSLMVLGQVVSALSDRRKTRKPPYRDSKLTRLLQDSLGGNSRTIMLACVSPADYNLDESSNTLRYATAARNIKNSATKNLVKQISQEEALALQRENQLLKQQVAELQEALRKMSSKAEEATTASSSALSPVPHSAHASISDFDTSPNINFREQMGGSVRESIRDQLGHSTRDQLGGSVRDHLSTSVRDQMDAKGSEDDKRKQVEASLRKELVSMRMELIKATKASGIELPALKVEVAHLRQEVKEKERVERENDELRQDLEDARADAAGARTATSRLADALEQLKEMRQDEMQLKRLELEYTHDQKRLLDCLIRILEKKFRQLKALHEDFDLVVKLATAPPVIHKTKGTFGGTRITEVDTRVRDELVKEHLGFYSNRMEDVQQEVRAGVVSLREMRDQVQHRFNDLQVAMAPFSSPSSERGGGGGGGGGGSSVNDAAVAEHAVLSQLVGMLISQENATSEPSVMVTIDLDAESITDSTTAPPSSSSATMTASATTAPATVPVKSISSA